MSHGFIRFETYHIAGKGELFVTGFTKTIPIGTRNEIQFIADY